MLNIFIVMVGVGLITPILPELIIEFDANGQAMGLLVAAYGITQFLLSPLTGSLSDRYGRKTFILAGLVIFSAAKLLFAVDDALWMLYASRLLEGVSAALIVPPMMAYVADITTTDERARGNSLLAAAMSFGFVVGPGLGGFLADESPSLCRRGCSHSCNCFFSNTLARKLVQTANGGGAGTCGKQGIDIQVVCQINNVQICDALHACTGNDFRTRQL